MSGIAFILTGCDFSAKNLGKVTFLEDADLTGLTISGLDSVSGITSQYSISYIPINTSQQGVTWSIISGGEYATIDTSTGLLTVLLGANTSAVTIKATSTVDNSIVATKNITVTYVAAPILLTALSISGSDTVTGTTSQYSVGYTPSNTTQQGVTWSITSGSQYATIDANTGLLTILSGANASAVTIKATSAVNNTITATKNVTVTYDNIIPTYCLPSAFQGNGSSTFVDTGVKLFDDAAKNWTIVASIQIPTTKVASASIGDQPYYYFMSCFSENTPYEGLIINRKESATTALKTIVGLNDDLGNTNGIIISTFTEGNATPTKVAISKNGNVYRLLINGAYGYTVTSAITTVYNGTLHLCCGVDGSGNNFRFSNAIINKCDVYSSCLTDDKIISLMNAM